MYGLVVLVNYVVKRVLCTKKLTLSMIYPQWNYDGSSTGQAEGHASEIILIPGALFNDPIRGAPHKMVMCETQLPTGEPALNNNRHFAKEIFDQALEEEPWFGLEQEYFIMDSITNQPLGYSEDKKQGQFYCSAGSANAYGRQLVEDHLTRLY